MATVGYVMRLMPALIAVAAVALVACGGTGQAVVPTPVSPPIGALSAWAAFPADHIARPVVLVANLSPEGGFGTSDAKIAALCHKFTPAIMLSTAIPRAAKVSWSTGTNGSYPSISAGAALTAMAQPGPGTSESYCKTANPIEFTSVRFGAYGFITDRGRAQIDSWLFTTSAFTGAMAYPALAPSAIWNADLARDSANRGSTVSADGLTLTFGFAGAVDTGPCGADYRGVVAESRTAVGVALQETPHSTDQNIACPAVAQQRTINVSLASPLGGRVVLDASGNLAPVCPVSKPDC